jgi:hypothetical protein
MVAAAIVGKQPCGCGAHSKRRGIFVNTIQMMPFVNGAARRVGGSSNGAVIPRPCKACHPKRARHLRGRPFETQTPERHCIFAADAAAFDDAPAGVRQGRIEVLGTSFGFRSWAPIINRVIRTNPRSSALTVKSAESIRRVAPMKIAHSPLGSVFSTRWLLGLTTTRFTMHVGQGDVEKAPPVVSQRFCSGSEPVPVFKGC